MSILQAIGRLRMSQLLMILAMLFSIWLLLIYTIFNRTTRQPQPLGYGSQGGALHDRVSDNDIEAYMRALKDTRPSRCLTIEYETTAGGVSIIMHYNEDEFYRLKIALQSVIRNTPDELFDEIILVDDGSVKKTVARHALEFLNRVEYRKVRQFRSNSPDGAGSARVKAAELAKGAIVVFVSGDAVVNRGWLPPLLTAVASNRRQIVTAHTDNFLSNFRFFATPDNYVNVFTWTLSTVFLETAIDDDGSMLTTNSPVMTGDVYAMDRSFLTELGGHDEGMRPLGGGDGLELSLRAWLCGGGIRIARCSRAAVHDALRARVTNSAENFRRIVELWLGGYKHFAYTLSGISSELSEKETISLRARRAELKRSAGECKPFSWFMQHAGGDLVVPTDRVHRHGKLKARTGYCLHPAVTKSIGAVDLILCRPHMYDRQLIFEMETTGAITINELCLRPNVVDRRLQLHKCDISDKQQAWTLTDDGKLTNDAQPGLCLTHEQTPSHHATLTECNDGRSQQWTIITY